MSKTLDRLQAVVEAATPGPWRYLDDSGFGPFSGMHVETGPEDDPTMIAYTGIEGEPTSIADATFIATARNTYPEALAVVRAAADLDEAQRVPAYSWVIESQAARDEGRPNREVERMDRINAARLALRAALAAFDEAATRSLP